MGSVEETVMGGADALPVKTREFSNHHMDSTIWNELERRPDDIVIATYAKSGTTWTQQIVSQLLHQGDPAISPHSLSPWVDLRPVPREATLGQLNSQTGRRFMKTHLPRDALPWDPKVKYIFIGRDGRDMVWSAHNHLSAGTPAFYDLFKGGPPYDGPELEPPSGTARDMALDLIRDDMPSQNLWPFWSHTRTWWAARHQPNLLMIHFNDLKADLDGQMRRIADFLGTPDMPADRWADAVEHCTFAWMKEHGDVSAPPMSDVVFKNGASDFINKGTNSRWKDVLSEDECRQYLEKAERELGKECANWLQHGGPIP